MNSLRGGALTLGAAVALALSACSPPDRVEIVEEAAISPKRGMPKAGTHEERYGFLVPLPPKNPFLWEAPDEWQEAASTQMRNIANYTFGPDGEGECYISFFQNTSGGVDANINRWRGQMDQEPLSAEEIAQLPEQLFLGQPATFLDVEGTYTPFRGSPVPDSRLLAVISSSPGITGTVKMTGPANLVAAERDNFLQFAASLRFNRPIGEAGESGDSAE